MSLDEEKELLILDILISGLGFSLALSAIPDKEKKKKPALENDDTKEQLTTDTIKIIDHIDDLISQQTSKDKPNRTEDQLVLLCGKIMIEVIELSQFIIFRAADDWDGYLKKLDKARKKIIAIVKKK